jgi:hypothetical protein
MNHIIVISDIHAGSSVGLSPPETSLDDGGLYRFSEFQKYLYGWWREFWDEWVPAVTGKEPYAVVVNGDAIEGVPHGTTTVFSSNLEDQKRAAELLLRPIHEKAGKFYMVRGTQAHGGKASVAEEELAHTLNACRVGNSKTYSVPDLWIQSGRCLIHFAHHVGVTSSSAYETSAVCRELCAAFTEAGQWREQSPDMIVRSHRHRFCAVTIPTKDGEAKAVITPGWQLKTPFVYQKDSMRFPQIGGICISNFDNQLVLREKIWAPTKRSIVKI